MTSPRDDRIQSKVPSALISISAGALPQTPLGNLQRICRSLADGKGLVAPIQEFHDFHPSVVSSGLDTRSHAFTSPMPNSGPDFGPKYIRTKSFD